MSKVQQLRDVSLNSGYQDSLVLDTAIIGAGTSGLYSAYRLTVDAGCPPGSVHLFESSDRIAGRLDSVILPGMQISGELGGMRYLNSQQIVTTLIEQVFASELTSIDFPMGDDAHLFTYLRKMRCRSDAWVVAQQDDQKLQTNYLLNSQDLGYSADQLFNKVVYDVLMADPWFVENYPGKATNTAPYQYSFTLTSLDWDAIKPSLTYNFAGPYQGLKLNDLGFWNLIKDRVSQEGYEFLDAGGGYYSNTINWNAAEAFPYMVGDFSDANVKYKTIEGGYDLIAYALAQHYLQAPGACIWSENKLLSFDYAQGGPRKYCLQFLNLNSGQHWRVFASNIVLAMPRRSLELLDQQTWFFQDANLQRNLESVIMEPSFKLLMGFEEPWWAEDFGCTAGHSVTDLPMRQCYYFGTDPNDSHSLFLASYNDMKTVTFWIPLNDYPERYQVRPTRLLAAEKLPASIQNQASAVMVAEAMNQVRELHGTNMNIPDPFVAWYQDWTADPFGGGYHAWKAGYSVKDVMPYMRRPFPDQSIHVCGEAYSDQQGWVEGAFCVAERMLQDHFGLQCPAWLDKNYYLGW
ncbi:FAD-dependent oxidoreductase [Pseudomonas sp. LS1212]|uniref:flavin monoamine oxidase family protein n=1 Tax=Pseudomonas sp. LS1212 TaxID=2972478 RepID=UPI00215D2667|nr:FAD-dependent oxidoreductase [Pseudomonas sp. LS1212]UVJ45922.1 FAD-dependent oxidoreductase [Pseudomonas sp. LS1212]